MSICDKWTERSPAAARTGDRLLHRSQLPAGGVPSASCDAVSAMNHPAVVRPRPILERDEFAVRIDARAHIGEKRGAVVVPAEFVLAAELQRTGLPTSCDMTAAAFATSV